MKASPTLVLASTSPRRIALMRQVGLKVKVFSPEIDETPLSGEKPKSMVKRLARMKAEEAVKAGFGVRGPAIIIAADTIVIDPGRKKILGKPQGTLDARKMLRSLAGKKHSVYTGYCILSVQGRIRKRTLRIVTSRVKMRILTSRQIDGYVKTGEPMDKAGSYAAQGLGMALIEGISGSYTNVVGLPMCELLSDLEKIFGISLFQKRK